MPPRMRPPTDADAAAVRDVIVACDIADLGAPDYTLADLRADWAAPGLELSRDARVIDGDGALAAYAVVTAADDAFVVVHPRAAGRGLGTRVRGWAEARAAERGVRVLRQYAYGSNERARTLLLHVFNAFRCAGLTYAELSVHARNRGALQLYRSAGMEPTFETERWEKAIAPG